MKIAQITCTFPPYKSGIGNSVYYISDALANLGHKVVVFTPSYDRSREEKEKISQNKFKIKRLKPLLKLGNAAFIPQLFWHLKNFDIIQFHYPFYGAIKPVLLLKFLFFSRIKLIMHYHMDARASGLKGVIFYIYKIIILPLMVRSADIVTCASLDYIKYSDLKSYYQTKPNKFKQISFGVNLEQFVTYHDDKNLQRREKVVLFVGGLDKAHYFKGLDILIKAIGEINKDPQFLPTNLNVIGQGNLLPYYKKCTEEYGAKNFVFFHDKVDNNKLVDYYNYCDCFVLPSINRAEAFGLALLEAMACSRPIIASNLPGIRSVFKNGEQGLLVEPNNLNDLISKIKFVLKNRFKAQKMGQAGRELTEKRYTWEKVARRLDSIFHYVKYIPKKL